MKSILEINKKKAPAVRIDPSLDKYDNIVLFPDKLVKANVQLKKSGFPILTGKKQAANILSKSNLPLLPSPSLN